MANQTKSNAKSILTLLLCGIAGSVIYKLPYLRETYYTALQAATGCTNAQLGMLMGAYGIVNVILYLPSGFCADRFSARKLMTFSLVVTGLTGFYFATMPSFGMIVALHCLWAVTTVFTFWTVCVRVVRELGDAKTQGRYYGLWSTIKGLTSVVVGFISVPIFAKMGEGVGGLKGAIYFYSIICIVVGIACWFVIDDTVKGGEKSSFSFKDFATVMKMPKVWLCGFIAMGVWVCYTTFSYVTPYLTNIYGLSETQTALVSNVRAYVLFALGGVLCTMFADKMKSRTIFTMICFVIIAALTSVYVISPESAGIGLVIAVMLVMGAAIYTGNAVFYSILGECNVPMKVAGTAAGVVSFVCYATDTFLWTTTGNMLDAAPGVAGYQHLFTLQMVVAIIGVVLCVILQVMNNKTNKELAAKEAK